VNALRWLENASGIRSTSKFLRHAVSEPGIFRINLACVVLAHGISERLEDAPWKQFWRMKWGMCRRRDILFAAIHMLVEAISGSPSGLVLGTRLCEEAKLRCDEEVLKWEASARSMRKAFEDCEFCVGSPLRAYRELRGGLRSGLCGS